MSREVCVCPSCQKEFLKAREAIEECLYRETELEGGVVHTLEDIEELRLVIGSFMDKKLLDAVLFLYKELSKEPRHSEMYCWFLRNSIYADQCKFALGALRSFKEKRLDRLEPLLERALEGVRRLRDGQ